uniref:hypothetical protein n=1 Tax=Neisseria sicca TaxID=490 RepID=UPI001C990247
GMEVVFIVRMGIWSERKIFIGMLVEGGKLVNKRRRGEKGLGRVGIMGVFCWKKWVGWGRDCVMEVLGLVGVRGESLRWCERLG